MLSGDLRGNEAKSRGRTNRGLEVLSEDCELHGVFGGTESEMTSLLVLRIDCTSGNHPQIQRRVGYDGRIPVRLVMSSGSKGESTRYFPTQRNGRLTT